jgi:anti-anti-sigma factor
VDDFTAEWQDGVLRLAGELDLAAEDDLLTAFRSASNDESDVILDLSELSFIDSTGIRALVTIAQEASPRRVILRSPASAPSARSSTSRAWRTPQACGLTSRVRNAAERVVTAGRARRAVLARGALRPVTRSATYTGDPVDALTAGRAMEHEPLQFAL